MRYKPCTFLGDVKIRDLTLNPRDVAIQRMIRMR